MRTTVLVLAALALPASEPDPTVFLEINVHNFDPLLYQILAEWVEGDGRLAGVLLEASSTAYLNALPGVPYWIVLADFRGDPLDAAGLGSADGHVFATSLVANARFVD